MENDDVCADVGILRLKKNGLRDSLEQFRERANSLLLLSFQWKDLEDHYEAIQHTIERRADELRVREEAVKSGLRDVEERMHFIEAKKTVFDLLWEAMDAKFRGLEQFGSKCRLAIECGSREVEERVEELESIVARVEEISLKEKEFESASGQVMESIKAKEKELKSKEVEIERKMKKVYECAVVVKTDKDKLNEALKSLALREKQFNDRVREVELKNLEFESDREKLDEFAKQLEEKDIEFSVRLKEVESRNKDVEDKRKELEWNKQKYDDDKKKLGERIRKMDCDDMRISCGLKELESKKVRFDADRSKLDEQMLELEGQRRKLETDKKKFEVDRKKLDEELTEFELKSKKHDDNRKAVELSKKEFGTELEQVKVKKEIEHHGKSSSCIFINGPTLQIFLNECWKDQEKIGFAVWVLLSYSSDPAKLVLDAVKSFLPPHLTKGGVEFSGAIVRRSCIFLLERLMGMSLKVNPAVKIEARRLSFDWIKKVKGDGEHTSEILGFLLLLAVYDLGSSFSLDDLLNYVKVVAHCRQVPNICRLLGMVDKIPGLIQDLIKRNKQTVAIRYVMEFNLVKQFSPDPLLKDHMETSEVVFNTALENGKHSLEAQIKVIDKRISDLKDVIRCIESYKIASGYSVANLTQVIATLENSKAQLRKEADHRVESNILPSYTTGIKANYSPMTSPWKASPNGVHTSSIQSIEMGCHHHGFISQDLLLKIEDNSHDKDVSLEFGVKLEGQSVDTSKNKDVDKNSVKIEVAKSLQASQNPARYVLLAVEEFLQSNKCGDEILLLLKELKKLANEIDQPTIVEARKSAVAWKSNMELKHSDLMEVSCFLIFLDVYRLISNFSAYEVLSLFDPKQLSGYFERIGMPEFLPDLIQKLINTNNRIKAIRYIHALKFSERFPIVTLLDEHLQYWKNQAEDICKGPNAKHHLQMGAINRRLAAIRSAMKLVKECKLESKYPIKGLEEAIADVMLKKAEKVLENGQKSSSMIENLQVDQQPSSKRKGYEEAMNTGEESSGSARNLKKKKNEKKEALGNMRPKKFIQEGNNFRGKFLNEYGGCHGRSYHAQETNHFHGGMDSGFR